ncbi:aldehyde-activating protein [Halioglobus maricola]|nr:aldehyde-activating protein [Halioglobus maricola]
MCHRIGALWAYYTLDQVDISADTELLNYLQGDRTLTLHSCGHCGCTTHYVGTDGKPDARVGVNMRMAPRELVESLPARRFDGAETWKWLD